MSDADLYLEHNPAFVLGFNDGIAARPWMRGWDRGPDGEMYEAGRHRAAEDSFLENNVEQSGRQQSPRE